MNVVLYFSPGGIDPELQTPVVDVEVCVRVSLFVHVTVPPTATAIGFGAYAFAANVVAPDTIDAWTPTDAGGEAGAAGEDEDCPQAVVRPNSRTANATRHLMHDLLVIGSRHRKRTASRIREGSRTNPRKRSLNDELRDIETLSPLVRD
jgi:hypothetical protein